MSMADINDDDLIKRLNVLRASLRGFQVANRIPGWQNDDDILERVISALAAYQTELKLEKAKSTLYSENIMEALRDLKSVEAKVGELERKLAISRAGNGELNEALHERIDDITDARRQVAVMSEKIKSLEDIVANHMNTISVLSYQLEYATRDERIDW